MGCSMTWRFVYACSTGTSHSEQGEVCQDMCQARVFCAPDGDEYFLGLVSDGAGSASHGGYGAAVACTQGVAVIGQWIQEEGSLARLTSETVKDWVVAIRQNICHTAEARGLTPRDFACTLLGAVVGTRAAAFFQIGDGAIVIGDSNGFHPVFWPDAGEYANMTYFVTDEDALVHLRMKIWLSSLESSLPGEVAM